MWQPIPAYVYLALLLTAPGTAVVFTQTQPVKAALIVILGGTMFLPELAAFDPPLLPAMDKSGIALGCALMGMLAMDAKRVFAAKPLRGVDLWFIFFVIGAVGTARTNFDTFSYGGGLHWNEVDHFPTVVLPPLRTYDALSMTIADGIGFWLPFFMGRVLVSNREDLRLFIKLVAFAGVIYVPLMVFEMIASPQLHKWTYGYHPSSFAHAVRGSGFKPMVYLKGGLAVAMFQYVALVCAAACYRSKTKLPMGITPGMAVGLIAMALLFSRSVGVLFYIAGTLPLMMMFSSGMQLRAAMVLVTVFMSFPYTRANDIFPADKLLETADKISHDRYLSLKVRFDNEDMLLERGMERPMYGWGAFGRNRVYDPWTGRDISITDGEWVTHLGSRGSVWIIGWFGILVWPVMMAWRAVKKVTDGHEKVILGILALGLAIHGVDMLPNSSFNKMLYFLAGAVVGAVRTLSKPPTAEEAGYAHGGRAVAAGAPLPVGAAMPPGYPPGHPGYPPGYPGGYPGGQPQGYPPGYQGQQPGYAPGYPPGYTPGPDAGHAPNAVPYTDASGRYPPRGPSG